MIIQDFNALVQRMALERNQSPGLIRYWLLRGEIHPDAMPPTWYRGCKWCRYLVRCTQQKLYLTEHGMPCEQLLPWEIEAIELGGFE